MVKKRLLLRAIVKFGKKRLRTNAPTMVIMVHRDVNGHVLDHTRYLVVENKPF